MAPWQVRTFSSNGEKEHHHTFADRGTFIVPPGYTSGFVNLVARAKMVTPLKRGQVCWTRDTEGTWISRGNSCLLAANNGWSNFSVSRLTTAALGPTPRSTNGVTFVDVRNADVHQTNSRQDNEDAERKSTTLSPANGPIGGDVYPVAWTKVTANAGDVLRVDGQIGLQLAARSCTNFLGGQAVLMPAKPKLASQARTQLERAYRHTRAGGFNLFSDNHIGLLDREGLFVVPRTGTYWVALYAYQLTNSPTCLASSVQILSDQSWVAVTRYTRRVG